jgi:hypothetical protein
MTEDEAKTKWCPHVRVLSDEGSMVIATVNRGGGLQADANCIASDCMMWRETDCESDPQASCMPGEEVDCLPTGYCRLGGKS